MQADRLKMKRKFTLKDAEKIIELVESNSSSPAYQSYLRIQRREIGTLKMNVKVIKDVVNNWGRELADLSLKERTAILHKAIWAGESFRGATKNIPQIDTISSLTVSYSQVVNGKKKITRITIL